MNKRLFSNFLIIIAISIILLINPFYSCRFPSKQIDNNANISTKEVVSNDTIDFLSKEEIDLLKPSKIENEILLIRKAYIVSYNTENKIPNWVAWHLTRQHTEGNIERKNNSFRKDEQVPKPRAENSDYKKSGWSRGHICPAGDNKWNEDAMQESFLLTNVCPQNPNLNSGVWNQIEITSRRWAEKFGDVYIISGPVLYKQEHQTIGENKVVVPEAFFKIIVRLNNDPKGIGFVCKNTDCDKKKDLYVNSINEIERLTGITFFPTLSKEISKKIKQEANINDWE